MAWFRNGGGREIIMNDEAHFPRLIADGWIRIEDPTITREEVTDEHDTTNDDGRLDNGSEKSDSRRSIDVPTVHRRTDSKRTGHKS